MRRLLVFRRQGVAIGAASTVDEREPAHHRHQRQRRRPGVPQRPGRGPPVGGGARGQRRGEAQGGEGLEPGDRQQGEGDEKVVAAVVGDVKVMAGVMFCAEYAD